MFWSLSSDLLLDPQQMNSYSYARNNPIRNTDPTGLASNSVVDNVKKALNSFVSAVKSFFGGSNTNTQTQTGSTLPSSNNSVPDAQQPKKIVLDSPVNGNPIVTSQFMENRSDCIACGSKIHSGTDYAVSIGTPVYSTAPGTVVESGIVSGFGNTIVIDHGLAVTNDANVYTLYAHGSSLEVNTGNRVYTGDLIMYSGNSGEYTTGPHLHYEVVKNRTFPQGFYKNINIRFAPESLSKLLFGE